MRLCSHSFRISLATLALAGRALASDPFPAHHEIFHPAPGDVWAVGGRALDLDGDGRPELVTGLWESFSDSAYVQIRRLGQALWDPGSVSRIHLKVPANGYIPEPVAAADLNGDGALDLVVPLEDSVLVLTAVAPGVFGAPIGVAYAPDAGGVAVADFDGDGILDLAVSLRLDRRVRIFHGVSPTSFVQVAEFPTHSRPFEVFTQDWNGDGKPDLLVGADTTSTVLLNDGIGGFQAYEVATLNARPAGDLNGDGHEDLISRGGVFLGNGDGTFQNVLAFTGLASVATADLDEDGRLDLVLTTTSPARTMSVRRGHGDGSFDTAPFRPYASGLAGQTITADFNGDGHIDVAEAGLGGTDFVMFGLGNGLFPEPLPVALNSPAIYVKKGEFGSHTGRDLLVVGNTARSMALLHATGLGTWSAPDSIPLPGAAGALGPEVADLNGDGRDDIVLGYQDQPFVSVWLTDASGHFGPRTDLATSHTGTIDVALGDLDQDGDVDILIQSSWDGFTVPPLPILWYRNRGDGQFDNNGTIPIVGHGNLEIRDLNGDGIPDLSMMTGTGFYGITVAIATAPAVFGTPVALVPQGTPYFALHFVVGRFDGDDIPDLVLTNNVGSSTPDAWFFHGNGDGSFSPSIEVQPAAFDVLAYAADLDGDGRDEIVNGTTVTRFKTDGSIDGVFSFAVGAGSTTTLSTVLDVDGNGMLDLVGSGPSDLSLRVMVNRAGPQTLGVRPTAGWTSQLALAPTSNPCGRNVRVRLTSASAEGVRVELLDVQGRRLRETMARPVAGGAVEIDLGATARFSPGVYLVRARQGQASAVARAIVVH